MANQEHEGHQHDHEPIHDQGQGLRHADDRGHGSKADEAGGSHRFHRASGSHEGDDPHDHDPDDSPTTSGGGSQGGGGGSHSGGRGGTGHG
jgi:hypothetical protein